MLSEVIYYRQDVFVPRTRQGPRSSQVNGDSFIGLSYLSNLQLPLCFGGPTKILAAFFTSSTKHTHIPRPSLPVGPSLHLVSGLPGSQMTSTGTPMGFLNQRHSHRHRGYQLKPFVRAIH